MRRILLAFIVFATSALAADFTGNWTGEGVTNGESHPLYFILKQAGNAVTGTGGPNASEQRPVQNGKVDGDKMIIEVGVGNKGTLHFEFKTDGDGLKGTVEVRRDDGTESGTVMLKRAT